MENLADIAEEERSEEEEEDDGDHAETEDDDEVDLPDGTGKTVLCVGGRGELDDAAASMLAQVLEVQGTAVRNLAHGALEPANLRKLDLAGIDTVVYRFPERIVGTACPIHGPAPEAAEDIRPGRDCLLGQDRTRA